MNTQTTLQFHGLPETWILALLVLPALLVFSCYVYARPHSKPILRRSFRSIRFSLLALALFLSFGPHWKQSETVEEPAALAILLDNSASMQHADTTDGSRLLQMQSILQTPNFQDLKHLYSVSTWSFGKQLSSTSPFGESLQGDEPETDIAGALRNLQTEFHGQDLARILLLSDGRDTNREPLDSTGTLLAESGIRVDALVFGETQETPDIILERIQGPEFLLVGDDALFRFQLRCNETAIGKPLLIQLFNSQGEEVQRIPLKRTPENPINLQFQQPIETAGDHQFQIKAGILPEETATQNNQLTFSFQADPTRIRVLYMDGEPRWEYRYLKNRLLRAKKDIAVTCWLAEASADFEQEHSAGLAPLQRVPLTTEELLAHYDVIILGDISPAQCVKNSTDAEQFLESVAGFVRRGGGLLMLAGPRHNPSAYKGSALEPLLPVVLSSAAPFTKSPFFSLPTNLLRPDPSITLHPNPETNTKIWKSAEALWWIQPVDSLRPGAQALLQTTHPDFADNNLIVAAIGSAPDGWVGWIGTDETWRWRFPGGEAVLEKLWRGLLRQLAATRLRGDQGRIQFFAEPSQVSLGDFVTLEVELLDEAWKPLWIPEGFPVFLQDGEETVRLSPVPGEDNRYRGRWRATKIGMHRFRLTLDFHPDQETMATALVEAVLPSQELQWIASDEKSLSELVQPTGGLVVSVQERNEILSLLDGRERKTRILSSKETPLQPIYFIFGFLGLACTEWILRKRVDLS
ncbi:MAG: hypothetical protein OTJ44_05920 [Planctomycetota bacterium]|nr:hypothetical protein [Planctomycetota bacterium]